MAEFMENHLKSGMEGLQIGESGRNSTKERGQRMKNRKWCPRRCHGDNTTEIARQQWRKMRHQHMKMRNGQERKNLSAWQGGPNTYGRAMSFHPRMMHGMGPHCRHGVNRGPVNMHMAGPMMMGGGPSPFSAGLWPMMSMMDGKPKFMDKMKLKASGKQCPENTDDKTGNAANKRRCRTSEDQQMPPFMMPWMMFREPQFRKFINKNWKHSKPDEHGSETEKKSEESDGSRMKNACEKKKNMRLMKRMMALQGGNHPMFSGSWCPPWMMQGGIHAKSDKHGSEMEHKLEDSDGSPMKNACEKKKNMRLMRRMMALQGGSHPMFSGALCPPWMMQRVMHRRRRCCKNKGEKECRDGDDSPTSTDEAKVIPEEMNDTFYAEVPAESILDKQEADQQEIEIQEAPAELPEGEVKNGEKSGKEGRNHPRQRQHRRWMREMMENGGFPAMWMMMSQQAGGFPKMKPQKNRNKENDDSSEN